MNYSVRNAKVNVDKTGTWIHADMKDQDDIPNIRGRPKQLCPGASYDYGYLVYDLDRDITLFMNV